MLVNNLCLIDSYNNKETKFDCNTGNNHICCPVAANEINKYKKKQEGNENKASKPQRLALLFKFEE